MLPPALIEVCVANPPKSKVSVRGTSSVVVRKDLHPATILLLAQALSEVHRNAGLFAKAGEFPTFTDPDYPMSQVAVDYYRNGMPNMEQYLPGRFVPYVQRLLAVLLAVGAVAFPIYSLAPGLLKSFIEWRLSGTYRRLREIDRSLHADSTAAQVEMLQAKLSEIDRELSEFGIPNGNSDMYFSIVSHLQLVHDRVNARRTKLQQKLA